jgi:hypothetical protein
MLGTSCIAAQLAASQEGLSSVSEGAFVNYLLGDNINVLFLKFLAEILSLFY